MIVDESYRRCVVHLFVDDFGEKKPVGTGFFVAVRLWGTLDELFVHYLVTARHVVRDVRDSTLYVRLNARGDGRHADGARYRDIRIDPAQWSFHHAPVRQALARSPKDSDVWRCDWLCPFMRCTPLISPEGK